MWGQNCNSCGSAETSTRNINKCQHCPTLICNGCKANHEFVCEQVQAKKKLGLGPTVRNSVRETETITPEQVGSLTGEQIDEILKDPVVSETLGAMFSGAFGMTEAAVEFGHLHPSLELTAVEANSAGDPVLTEALAAVANEAAANLMGSTSLSEALATSEATRALLDPTGVFTDPNVLSPLTLADVLAPEPPSTENLTPAEKGVDVKNLFDKNVLADLTENETRPSDQAEL